MLHRCQGAVYGVRRARDRLRASTYSSTPLIANFTENLHFVVRNGSKLQVHVCCLPKPVHGHACHQCTAERSHAAFRRWTAACLCSPASTTITCPSIQQTPMETTSARRMWTLCSGMHPHLHALATHLPYRNNIPLRFIECVRYPQGRTEPGADGAAHMGLQRRPPVEQHAAEPGRAGRARAPPGQHDVMHLPQCSQSALPAQPVPSRVGGAACTATCKADRSSP